MENQNNSQTERELRALFRFFAHKIPKYLFIVLDDERMLNYLIVRIQIELKKKKKDILHLQLSDKDAYVFRQVKNFLKENQCDGLMVTNLNTLIYGYDIDCIDLLNKSRDAFARFHLPIVFVINADNQKKIIDGASDFYQLRTLADIHFEGFTLKEDDVLNISFREFDRIKDSNLKASLLEKQLKVVIKKKAVGKKALNDIIVPLASIYIDKNEFKRVTELFNRFIKDKEKLVRDKIVLGDCYRNMFDFEKAIHFYKKALDYYQNLRDNTQVLKCFQRLGDSYCEIGSYDEAKSCYEISLKLGKEIGDKNGIAASLHKIGLIYQFQGRFDEALRQYQQSLEIDETIGDIAGTALNMNQIGMINEEKKDLTTALKLYLQSFTIFSQIGSPRIGVVKGNIDNIRKNLSKEEFEAIVKEFEYQDI